MADKGRPCIQGPSGGGALDKTLRFFFQGPNFIHQEIECHHWHVEINPHGSLLRQ